MPTPTITVSIRLTEPEHAALAALAARRKTTPTAIITAAARREINAGQPGKE